MLLFSGQLLRFPVELVSFKHIAIVPSDLALIALAGLLMLKKLKERRLFFPKAALLAPLFVFLLCAIVSLAVNADYYRLGAYEVRISFLYLLRWVLYCVPYFAVVDLVRSRNQIRELFLVLGVGVTLFAIFGIFQAIFLPSFTLMLDPENPAGWELQQNRLVSTFFDANFAGCLIGMALAGVIALWMEGFRKLWFLVVIFGAALILTYSRGSALAFLVGFGCLILAGKYKRRAIAVILIILLIVVAGLPYFSQQAEYHHRFSLSDTSSQNRFEAWRISIKIIRDNFMFGIGFNTTPYVVPRFRYISPLGYNPEGGAAFAVTAGLLTIFGLTGVFGFVAYCFIYGKGMWMAWVISKKSRDPFYRALAKGTFAQISVLIVSGFFTLTILHPFITAISWILFGLLSLAYYDTVRPTLRPGGVERGPRTTSTLKKRIPNTNCRSGCQNGNSA